MARYRSFWVYSAGLAVAWGIVLAAVFSREGQPGLQRMLPVFGGFCIGWVSTTIARYVYPPARVWVNRLRQP